MYDNVLNKPINELQHAGVKGMKWGVRKVKPKSVSLSAKTKSGETLNLQGNKTPLLAKALAAVSKKVASEIEKSDNISIKDSSGKKVGNLQLYRESKDSMNIVWVGVNKKHEGKGYGQAAMQSAITYAKKKKLKTVTLEVPGISPNARHIYEKMGFKAGKTNKAEEWGDLTDMTLEIKHGQLPINELQHAGVKGMKWGVRKDKEHKSEKKAQKADKKWEKELTKKGGTSRAYVKAYNETSSVMNSKLNKLNEKFKDAGNVTNNKSYNDAADAILNTFPKVLQQKLNSQASNISPSKKKRIEYIIDQNSGAFVYKISDNKEIKHAGVKGMKWGVRKDYGKLIKK